MSFATNRIGQRKSREIYSYGGRRWGIPRRLGRSSKSSKMQNMMPTNCSRHFMEAYGEYKRALWRSQEEERLKLYRSGFASPNYEEDNRISSQRVHSRSLGNIYDDITFRTKCPQTGALIEVDSDDESKESENNCIWNAELQEKRESIYAQSISATHLERLQRLVARRNTLPENVFSQLKDKCSQIKSQRVVHPITYEEDEEEEEEDQDDDEEEVDRESCNDQSRQEPGGTKLLVRRSRQLTASLKNRPQRQKSDIEQVTSIPHGEEMSGKASCHDMKFTDYKSILRRTRVSSEGNGKVPITKTLSNERNKISETLSPSTRQTLHTTNNLAPQLKRNCFVSEQTDANNNCTTSSIKYNNSKIPKDVNISHPKRNRKFNSLDSTKATHNTDEKKKGLSVGELNSCRYLRDEILSNTCTCKTCEGRKAICKNCKTNKQLEF